jgi:hypothetical protein
MASVPLMDGNVVGINALFVLNYALAGYDV